jgi:hypothetical protein
LLIGPLEARQIARINLAIFQGEEMQPAIIE